MCNNQNLLFPKILEEEALQRGAVVERRFLIDWLVPIHRKVAADDVHPIFGDFATVGKTIATGVFVDGATATQLSESSMSQLSVF
jgi:hypothetical protein